VGSAGRYRDRHDNGLSGPNYPIIREQLAPTFWQYAGSPVATNKELHFSDVDNVNDYA